LLRRVWKRLCELNGPFYFYWSVFGLKVVDGRLYGTCLGARQREIRPEDILDVRQYFGNNPFVGVVTFKGNFRVGPWTYSYKDVLHYLDEHTRFGCRLR